MNDNIKKKIPILLLTIFLVIVIICVSFSACNSNNASKKVTKDWAIIACATSQGIVEYSAAAERATVIADTDETDSMFFLVYKISIVSFEDEKEYCFWAFVYFELDLLQRPTISTPIDIEKIRIKESQIRDLDIALFSVTEYLEDF
jgi:uncharacterized membrane protein